MPNHEAALLETALQLADHSYQAAYDYLKRNYQQLSEGDYVIVFYFLACLAGGAGQREEALAWLKLAIDTNGYFYRPAMLADDDLESLEDLPEFRQLKAASELSYRQALAESKPVFTHQAKTADNLFIAVHGNGQNLEEALTDWAPLKNSDLQLEAVQSAIPDSTGRYRWNYDEENYQNLAEALEKTEALHYQRTILAGFSAGCDMILRTIAKTGHTCAAILLQSPWLPFLEAPENLTELMTALRQKQIKVRIFCGDLDEDCLRWSTLLHDQCRANAIDSTLVLLQGLRHRFPDNLGEEYFRAVDSMDRSDSKPSAYPGD